MPPVAPYDEPRVVFTGFRPKNWFEIHDEYKSDVVWPPIYKKGSALSCEQRNFSSDWQFDSQFESGNLDMAIQTSDADFNLYVRPDTNTRGYCNWFYFRVTRSG